MSRNPFALTFPQVGKALLLGVLAAVCYMALVFGDDLARFQAMEQALAAVETCETDGDCQKAWAMVQAAKGGN